MISRPTTNTISLLFVIHLSLADHSQVTVTNTSVPTTKDSAAARSCHAVSALTASILRSLMADQAARSRTVLRSKLLMPPTQHASISLVLLPADGLIRSWLPAKRQRPPSMTLMMQTV